MKAMLNDVFICLIAQESYYYRGKGDKTHFMVKGRDQTMKKLIAAGIILLILGLYFVVGSGAV